MTQGEIYKRKCGPYYIDGIRYYFHNFIYLEIETEIEERHCLGIMLTHSSNNNYLNNKKLNPKHIMAGYEFKCEYNSYYMSIALVKDIPTSKVVKTGELTEEGLKYFLDELKTMKCITWKEYQQHLKKM